MQDSCEFALAAMTAERDGLTCQLSRYAGELDAMTARAEKAETELGLEEPAADSPMGVLTHQLMIVGQERKDWQKAAAKAAQSAIDYKAERDEGLQVINELRQSHTRLGELYAAGVAELEAVEKVLAKWCKEDFNLQI